MASEPTLSSLAQLAASASTSTTADVDALSSAIKTKEQQRRHYVRALHRVVDDADVILLVLDARDPAGCRSRLVEEEVKRRESEGKRLVFVLNKIGAQPALSDCIDLICIDWLVDRFGAEGECAGVVETS